MQTNEAHGTVLMNIDKNCIMTKKNQSLLLTQDITASMNERVGNTTIDEAIARNHRILLDHFFDPLLELDDYIKLLEDIRAAISDPALQVELEARWRNEDIQRGEATSTLLRHVKYACLYLELARTAEVRKDRDRAWAFTNYASLIVGEIIEKSATILNARDAESRAKQNSKNAQGRNNSILPVKEEAARLLHELKPKTGWPYKTTAVTKLTKPLSDFIKKNNTPILQISNIENWLTEWLREDEHVNRAWENSKRVKIR